MSEVRVLRKLQTPPEIMRKLPISGENIKKQYIVFRINGKDLQSKNVHLVESELIFNNNEYYIVHKKLDNLNIFITYKNIEENNEDTTEDENKKKIYSKFIRGYIYKDNRESNIKSFDLYSSLQIGEWAYDNIGICSIEDIKDNIF